MDMWSIENDINLTDLIENIPGGCFIYRTNIQPVEFVVWNKHMLEITGYTMNEINEIGWNNILCNTSSLNESIYEATVEKEYNIKSKNDTKKIVTVTTSIMTSNDGESITLALVKDVTKSKHKEQELIEIQERYEKILQISTDSIFIHDGDKYIYVNNNTFNLFGLENASDIIGDSIYKFIPPSFQDIVKNRLTTELENKGSVPIIEETLINSNGENIIVEVASSYVPYMGNKCILTFVRNINAGKELENKLKESEAMLRQVTENSLDMITICDTNGIIQYGTPSNKTTLGYDLEEFVGLNVFDLVHPNELSYVKLEFEDMKLNHHEKNIRCSLRCRDGNYICMEIRGKALNDGGPIERFIFSSRDISDRKKAEELEKDMNEKSRLLSEAAEYEKLRTEFFANISHELRTPINVILSSLQLLDLKINNSNNKSLECCKEYKKYPAIMKQNCYRLVRLINNLIDVTKIDSGYFNLNLINTNIVNVVEDITLSVIEYIENKGISLIFDTEIEEKILACDPDKIERIILNLISNAVKFTEPGGSILINIIDMKQNLIISVKDTGIGISKDKQKDIFERFVQVDKSLTRNREGSGIGLSLVKSLVEMHKGSIEVKSELTKGSEFIITLPCCLVEKTDETVDSNNYFIQGNSEKINVEFSDIYY